MERNFERTYLHLPDDDDAVVSLFDIEVVCVDAPET